MLAVFPYSIKQLDAKSRSNLAFDLKHLFKKIKEVSFIEEPPQFLLLIIYEEDSHEIHKEVEQYIQKYKA
jgi:hypothetical protein